MTSAIALEQIADQLPQAPGATDEAQPIRTPDAILQQAQNLAAEEDGQAPQPPIDPKTLAEWGHLLPAEQAAAAEAAPATPVAPTAEAQPQPPQEDPRLAYMEQQNALLMQMLQRFMTQPQSAPQVAQPQAMPPPPPDPVAEQAKILAEMQRFTLPDGRRLSEGSPAEVLAYMTYREQQQRSVEHEKMLQAQAERIAKYEQHLAQQQEQARLAHATQQVTPAIQQHLTKNYGPNLPPNIGEQIASIAAENVVRGYDPRASIQAAVEAYKPWLEWAKTVQPAPKPTPATPPRAPAPAPQQARDPQTGQFRAPSAADRAMGVPTAQPGKPKGKPSPDQVIEINREMLRRGLVR